MSRRPVSVLCVFIVTAVASTPAFIPRASAGVNYEEAPIRYSASRDDTAVSRLQRRLEKGEAALSFEEPHGYLKSVLRELDVPVSSQVLVFAKTSLQADKISPKTPRAIYFNDEVHVGYVQRGMLEIAAADPELGMVFYTLDQTRSDKPLFERQNNRCLNCHGAARTRNVPGLLVRSVHPDPNGQPVIAAGSFVTTHASPFEKRWGGWYVTGTHGDQKHLGNFLLPDAKKPKSIDNAAGLNVADLTSRFDTAAYLTPHSDLVALMVLEHQTEAYNLMTQATFETRAALAGTRPDEGAGEADAEQRDDDESRKTIEQAARRIVRHFLFADETPLTAPLRGTSGFAREYERRGPRTPEGTPVREFDLRSRLFKIPCSPLLHSPRFAALPPELKRETVRQIEQVVSSAKNPDGFERLGPEDRRAVAAALKLMRD